MTRWSRASGDALAEPLATETLAEALVARKAKRTGTMTNFRKWSMRVLEPKTGVLDFERFPFQPELYDHNGAHDEDLVVKKATQTGVSTYLMRWALYWPDQTGKTSLYVFPKRQQMFDFSDARINAAIDASPYLQRRIKADYVQNKGLKRIGIGFAYFRGSESKADLDAIDADSLALDEYDMLRPENVPDAERRITGSVEGRIRRVGVPSIPGWGIDELYALSDRRQWLVKCGACGEHQPITYDKNVDEENARIVCGACRKPLDVAKGEWVAEYPDRTTRGYHIPRLIVPNANLGSIITAHYKTNPTDVQVHHNKDLGEAYSPKEGRLSLEAIQAAQRRDIATQATEPTGTLRTMGVDTASARALNIRASVITDVERGMKANLWLGELDNFGKVAELIDRLDPHVIVIDHAPEGRLARALAERYPGRAWLVRYGPKTQKTIISPNAEMAEVSVLRTTMLDITLDGIRTQANRLPGELPLTYAEHMQSEIRVASETPEGRKEASYRKVGPANDYLHAECYDTVAMLLWRWQRAVNAGIEGEYTTLDEVLEFERAHLDAGTKEAKVQMDPYDPGFDGGADPDGLPAGYDPGFE